MDNESRLMDNDNKLAVLIDAENVSSKYLKAILDEISKYGIPTYKRIYGDWTTPQMTSWKSTLLENAIIPMQQYSYVSGKNSTDSALIIDAMDILYTGNVDGFCIVSSDSDFTRLATRLREAGRLVIGFGEKKTPLSFISSCNKFVYIEVLLVPEETPTPASTNGVKHDIEHKIEGQSLGSNKGEIMNSLRSILNDISDDQGWALLSSVGSILSKRHPDFDTRNYKCRNLTEFVKKLGIYEIDSRPTKDPKIRHNYIRLKVTVTAKKEKQSDNV